MRRVVQQFSEREQRRVCTRDPRRRSAPRAWTAGENAKPGLILRAEGSGMRQSVRYLALGAYRIEFCAGQGRSRAFGSYRPLGGTRRPRSRLAGRVVVVSRSRRVSHHHRFLERPIVRVPIITLWQIGYTVKKCPPFGRQTLTNATKREQCSTAPERARIRLGEEPCGFGVLGGRTL